MRRIALLVSSMMGGGAERVAATLANAWNCRGWEVVLVPTYLSGQEIEYQLDSGVQIKALADAMSSSGALRRVPVASKLRALRSLVRTISPDVTISFLTNVNIAAILALQGLGTPLAVCERVDPAASIELPVLLRVARSVLYQFAGALVAQTAVAAQRYRSGIFRAPEMVVIPNPIPAPLYRSAMRASPGTGGGEIVGMGRLTTQKRFDRLIRAFEMMFRGDRSWNLTIWGEGPLRQPLQKLIDELGMHSQVKLAGRTTEPWEKLRAAQMFVLSSQYEGFPNVMLEAMALGVPCVAFDCPSGPRDLAGSDDCAVLVPPGDVRDLAAKMRELADDVERRACLGRIASESVRARFSEPIVLAKWERLLDMLTDGNQAWGRGMTV